METATYSTLSRTPEGSHEPPKYCWSPHFWKDLFLFALVVVLFVTYGTSMVTIKNLDDDLTKLKKDFYASATVPAVQLDVIALNTTLYQTIAAFQQLNASYTDFRLTSPFTTDSNGAIIRSDNIYFKNSLDQTIFWFNTFGLYTLGGIAKIRLNGFNRPIDEILDFGTCGGNSGTAHCV